MEPELRCVRTILVVEKSLDNATDLQDRIVRSGYRVLTACSFERALELANCATLDDAVIDFDFGGADEIVCALKVRQIPFVFHAAATAAERSHEQSAPAVA